MTVGMYKNVYYYDLIRDIILRMSHTSALIPAWNSGHVTTPFPSVSRDLHLANTLTYTPEFFTAVTTWVEVFTA